MPDLPRQKLPYSEKNDKWREDCVNAIIEQSEFGGGFKPMSGWRGIIQKCYEYYSGIIDDQDYDHVLKPYGKERQSMPAKLRNYPIIKPIVDLLLGEKKKRPINSTVGVLNSDVVTKKTEAMAEHLNEMYQQMFVNLMNEQGLDTGMPSQQTPTPEETAKAFETTYRDERAIRGQMGLDYIMSTQEVPRKLQDGWKDFLISGRVFSRRGVNHNEPEYEILNPLHVDYSKDATSDFVEDAIWQAYRRFLSPANVLDEFYDHLSPEDVRRLDDGEIETTGPFFLTEGDPYLDDNEDSYSRGQKRVEVVNVYWKSMEKIGFVDTYDSETGEEITKEVDELYKALPGEKVEWLWRSEAWQGTKIGDDLFVDIRPCTIQRRSLDNKSTCKLPINGRKYSDRNAPAISLVMLMIPYQLQYNVYKYRLDLSVAKSKDLIAVFDINMLPTEKGIDMDTWLYHIEATGIAWVDYNKEGVRLNPVHQTVLDMSIKTMESYIRLLESIVIEMERMTGVTRQRQGQTSAYELKSTTEQSIIQSSHITEDMFARFADFERRDLQALLDYSKEAWIEGKKAMYVLPDLSEQFFSIDGIDHMESEYGIVISDSYEERQKIEIVRQLGQAMVQNGTPISNIISIIEAHSLPQIKAKIADAEANQQKLVQAQQQAEQQNLKAQQDFERAKMQNENDQKEKDRQNKLEIAMMQAENTRLLEEMRSQNDRTEGLGGNPELDLKRSEQSMKYGLESKKLTHQKEIDHKQLELETKKLSVDKALKEKEIQVKKAAASRPVSKN